MNTCRLCPWPWAFLSLASRWSVLGRAVLCLGLKPCVLDSTSDYHVIFQACLKHTYVPSAWQQGTGIFLPKPEKISYFEAKSFRVITLTFFQQKWLERLILYHINEDNNAMAKLSASQYGFRTSVLRKLLSMNLFSGQSIALLEKSRLCCKCLLTE